MKIALISPYNDITSLGVRSISACLKKAGHRTRLIFLASSSPAGQTKYDSRVLEQLIELCNHSDLIGISLMTNFFESMAHLTSELKSNLDIPVIWGGIHPSSCPEECLRYADMVCIGDGEGAIVEIANRMAEDREIFSTNNIWFQSDNGIIKNPLRPLCQDLDSLPFPDYDLTDDFVLDENECAIIKMDKDVYKYMLENGHAPQAKNGQFYYQTLTSRGCPHNCSYCWNSTFITLYKGEKYLRWRSPEKIIAELASIKERFEFINLVIFSDDTLFIKPVEEIKRLSRYYKEKIGIPFNCLGSPLTITEEKMEYLVDAGLVLIEMGIESGSLRTRKLYNRRVSNERIIEAARIIDKFRSRMEPPFYDFLVDNPFETPQDQLDSLRLITQLPAYSQLHLFSLVMFPGTDIYIKAKEEDLIKDDSSQIYRKQTYIFFKKSYTNFLFYLAGYSYFTRRLLPFFLREGNIELMEKLESFGIYYILYWFLESIILVKKGIKGIIRGDVSRIHKYLMNAFD